MLWKNISIWCGATQAQQGFIFHWCPPCLTVQFPAKQNTLVSPVQEKQVSRIGIFNQNNTFYIFYILITWYRNKTTFFKSLLFDRGNHFILYIKECTYCLFSVGIDHLYFHKKEFHYLGCFYKRWHLSLHCLSNDFNEIREKSTSLGT